MIVDLQVPGDGRLSHEVEDEPEEVVDDGRHRATVSDAWRADVPGIEDVLAHYAFTGAPHLEVMTVCIVRPAAEALRVVRWQDVRRCGPVIEAGGPVREHAVGLTHAAPASNLSKSPMHFSWLVLFLVFGVRSVAGQVGRHPKWHAATAGRLGSAHLIDQRRRERPARRFAVRSSPDIS
ncbi:hypothetical protein GCM10010531_05390 [Blastococcus jejuensis]|uniref:Uncharacterized protein n=1 Tax=Blastococcus jejuensis TaxID=351224 RepID=A0ABP6NT69_9ACTN